MSFQFEIVAPAEILEEYRDLFESKCIFYTQLLPEDNPTHVVLEDSTNMYSDTQGWRALISTIVGHILREKVDENLTFKNLSENYIEIFKR